MTLNTSFATLLEDAADLLEIKGVDWKPQAYRKAARAIKSLDRDIKDIYSAEGEKGLDAIAGVGKGIADHIIEYIKTGQVKKFEALRKKMPSGVIDLMHIEGLGPSKVKTLTQKLNVRSISDLKKVIASGKLEKLEGFGQKTAKNILQSISLFEAGQKRMLIGDAYVAAQHVITQLTSESITYFDYAGSLRRGKETIGDLDLLVVSSDPTSVMKQFTTMPDVSRVLAHGATKSSVILKGGIHVDLRVVEKKSLPAALNYFTGSKDHNIALRQEALKRGWKLSEYGLFDKKTKKAFLLSNEEALYRKLSMQYIPPEMREMRGEIDLAKKKKIPSLVSLSDIKGDLHMHTKLSDGMSRVEEMVAACVERGYSYMAITDHSQSLRIAHGLSVDQLKKQWKDIDRVQKKVGNTITILRGTECDILKDGSLDYPGEILKKMDVVIGSVHSGFKMTKKEMTERVCSAVSEKRLSILGHPTGRLINQRAPYELDVENVFAEAAQHGKIMEINAQPKRLDLRDTHIMRAKEMELQFSIDTDSHHTSQLDYMRFGVETARRGWLEKKDVVNTLPLGKLRKLL